MGENVPLYKALKGKNSALAKFVGEENVESFLTFICEKSAEKQPIYEAQK